MFTLEIITSKKIVPRLRNHWLQYCIKRPHFIYSEKFTKIGDRKRKTIYVYKYIVLNVNNIFSEF